MNRFYVYGWYLSDGTCFYVGKGTGDRYRERSRRNEYWINIVAQVEALQKTGSAQKALWQDPEYRAHMVEVHTGHTHTEETKAKIGTAHKGQKRPKGTGEKIAATKRGKPRSEETKAKIRATLLNKRGSVTVTGTY